MTDSTDFVARIVDGQRVLFPTADAWRRIRMRHFVDAHPVSSIPAAWHVVDFALTHGEFVAGLFLIGVRSPNWMPIAFLRTQDGRLQRVFIETINCDNCNNRVVSANPEMMDLYIGVPDRWAALDRGAALPKARCPVCDTKLKRSSVWSSLE